MANNSLSNISVELKAAEKMKKEAIKEAFEYKISELEKLLKIQMIKDIPNNNYELYTGLCSGKEIRIGGEKYNKAKKILIFDALNLNVIYTGMFTEDAEHYVAIIRAYGKKDKKQTGYYRRL